MRNLIARVALGSLVSASALAADHEVSLEAGTTTNASEGMRLIADTFHQPTYGVRGAISLHERVALVLSGAHGQYGHTLVSGIEGYSAWYLTEASVGCRADVEVADGHLFPYGQAQVVGFHSLLRFSDTYEVDPETVQNYARLGLGARITLGIEIQTMTEKKVRPAIHVEAGWAGALPYTHHTTDASGNRVGVLKMGWSGATLRGGAGIRF